MPELSIVYVWDADYPWDVRTEKSCLALTQAGHRVHIVARNRKRRQASEQLPEGTVHRMRPWRWAGPLDGALGFPAFFSPRWTSLIARVCTDVEADVVITRDLPLAPAAIRIGHRLGIPVMLDMAEHYPAMMRAIWETGRNTPVDWLVRNPRIVERVERYCLANADHVLVVAEEMADRLARMGVDRSRMTRVSNTPMLDGVHPMAKSTNATTRPMQLVYLGILEVVRGINELLDAVAFLRARATPCTLLLIGTGRDEQLFRDRAASLGLTGDDVEFAGYVPYARAMERVAAADVGMLPLHRNEHMDTTEPNKLFDYMSVGLPVVTSDTIPSARIVRAERAGAVFEAANSADLARVLESLASRELRIEMGTNGRAAVERFYNWAHDAKALVDAVEKVSSRPRSASREARRT